MVSDSILFKTLVDILIIGVCAYAFQSFLKYRHRVPVKELRVDFFLIMLGISVIGLFYAVDIVTMHALPLVIHKPAAIQAMRTLHGSFEWFIAPAGLAAIAAGFSRGVLAVFLISEKLKRNEDQVRQMGEEAESDFTRANRRVAELTEQNKQFHQALENMSQGLCMFDVDQKLIVSNDRYASLYGLTKEQMRPGTSFSQILQYRIDNNVIMGDDPEKYIEERFLSVREKVPSSKIQRLSDGRVLAIAHRPLPDGGWVATHEDISGLAKAEAMNQRLARIVENAINEVYVFDAESLRFLQVNKSACSNLGYTMEEMGRLTPLDINPDTTGKSFEELVAPLRSGEKPHIQFDAVHRRKDGSLYDVKVTLQQIRSQNQQVFAAIIEDVTERKLVERQLKQSKELFSKAFQANPVPFSISGPDGVIYDVNEAFLTTLGYTREEAIGNSSLKLGIWLDPKERARFVELLKEKGTIDGYETKYRTKYGEVRDMVVSGEWVEIRGEARMFNISNDVTERKATERRLLEDRDTLQKLVNEATADLKAKAQELEAALAKEKELNELQRQFVSMASHEFRTPLAIIDSTAQRLKKSAGRLSADDALKRIDKIRSAVERMTRLMESSLTAARLEEGRVAIEMQPCDVGRIVSDVCLRLQEIARDHVISCEMRDLPAAVRADASAIDQVITNLLSNAIKYSPGSPDIQVKAFGEGEQVVIQVRDRGLGIDEDDLPKMFGRFFRAKTSTGIVGTGIGLNLVKTLVEMHGGTVGIESARGEGSTFTVSLPVAGPRREVPEKSEKAA